MKKIEFKPTDYPSDLTDAEWKIIEPMIPIGNKSEWHKRSLINAVNYIEKTGCQWRYLPKDYPPHDTVWSFFRRARGNGLWKRIKDMLVIETRKKAGRNESPSYAIIDSQSVKTIAASEERGIDGGKKNQGSETSYSG
jgi:putative transposase